MSGRFEPVGDLPESYADACRFRFGDSPEMADELLALVISERKSATCGALRDYGEHNLIPEVGRRDVVVDGRGRPRAVIETTAIRTGPISSVSLEHVLAAGEGETSVDAWLESYRRYFDRNGGFDPEMPVVFERFRLVEVL